jgi:hypothetical protein
MRVLLSNAEIDSKLKMNIIDDIINVKIPDVIITFLKE